MKISTSATLGTSEFALVVMGTKFALITTAASLACVGTDSREMLLQMGPHNAPMLMNAISTHVLAKVPNTKVSRFFSANHLHRQ